MITRMQLKEWAHYDGITGIFTWKKDRYRCREGQTMGHLTGAGYIVIGLLGKLYYAHRLVFLYTKGTHPEQVDHQNNNRSDNRISNLRAATHQQNCFNKEKKGGKSSVYKGVCLHKRSGKWLAYIDIDNSRVHLGYFDDELDAAMAYNKEARTYYGKFAKLNVQAA